MSEVLIRMKMPKCCEECRFFAWKRGVGQHCAVDDRITFHATLDGFDVGYERNGECPLVPVPSHGRLIDTDELCNRLLTAWNTENKEARMMIGSVLANIVTPIIAGIPTIIPAEEE